MNYTTYTDEQLNIIKKLKFTNGYVHDSSKPEIIQTTCNDDYNGKRVRCNICGHVSTQVSPAHIKKHGITSAEYKVLFPNSIMRIISNKCKAKAGEEATKRNKSTEQKAKVSAALAGKTKSEEHKQALKDAKAREDKELRSKINGDNRRGKPNKLKENINK